MTGDYPNECRTDAPRAFDPRPWALACAELAHNGWRGSRQIAAGSGDQNRASVRQGRTRLLAPERPRQTDDGGAVHDWKESRARPGGRPTATGVGKIGSRGRSQLAYTRERECRTRLEDRARLAIRQQKWETEGAHLPAGEGNALAVDLARGAAPHRGALTCEDVTTPAVRSPGRTSAAHTGRAGALTAPGICSAADLKRVCGKTDDAELLLCD